jgi:prepilin signal peptidase PulO-like enzyme (type II secretory pathway)
VEILLLIIVYILGCCFGSFVNMLVYRTAINYELESQKFKIKNKNRSFCDYCGRQLKWHENIPVISYIIQKGKTRCCQKKLLIAYPVIEVITGLLFLINFKFLITNFSITGEFHFVSQLLINLIISFVIIVFLVFSAVFDLKYMVLPDFSTIVLVFSAVINLLLNNRNSLLPYLASALIGCGFLWFLNFITKGKGMGWGDVKYAIFIGLFLGFPKTVIAFYTAFIVGAIVGIFLMLLKKAHKKTMVAFGPYLILGTIIAWWWGEKIWQLIFGI